MPQTTVWFITGASRGFGRIWTEAALARGDYVAAAARDLASLSPLQEEHGERILPVQLDVSDRSRAYDAMHRAHQHFGRIDVLVNNAGFGLVGALEEINETDARSLFDTNVFGSLWVTQAALPIMRSQGAGHIISVSSVSGLMGQPTIGLYNASKWALEGMMEALHEEVQGLGISVTLLEPGIYATEFASAASLRLSKPLSDYDDARARLHASLTADEVGDPHSTVEPLLSLVDATNPPLRLLLGETSFRWAVRSYGGKLSAWATP